MSRLMFACLLVVSGCVLADQGDLADASAGPTGDNNGTQDPCADPTRVYYRGEFSCASTCPDGEPAAYVMGSVVVCDECDETGGGCGVASVCDVTCIADCQTSTGGCCPVNECIDP